MLTTEPVTDDEYGIPSEIDDLTLSRLHHRFSTQPETIKSEDDEYFHTLRDLREKYHNLPRILNYQNMGYDALGKFDKVKEVVIETYNMFPRYLFAMTGTANIYLGENQPTKVEEIFGNAKSLKEVYPTRTQFHVSEGRTFHHTLAYYYCVKGELTLAINQFRILVLNSKLMDFEDDPLLDHIISQLLKLHDIQHKAN